MSGLSTTPPPGSTGAVAQSPLVAAGNVTGAPASTVAGLGFLGMLLTSLSSQGLPTNSQGWFSFGIQAIAGLGSIFLRA